MLSHACRVSADLLTLCEPAFRVLEFPFGPLHITNTRAAVMCWYNGRRFQQAQEVHVQMRRPIFLQSCITKDYSGILGLHSWMTDSTGKCCSCSQHDRSLQFYGNIPGMVVHAQAVDTRSLFSPPTRLGNERYMKRSPTKSTTSCYKVQPCT